MTLVASRAPRAGEVWWVNFSPQIGREQAGLRLGLVISTDAFNDMGHALLIVVPMTTRDRQLPNHVKVNPPEAGLRRVGFCMCEQVKSISVDRLDRSQGSVEPATLRSVRSVVGRFFDL